MWAMSAEMQSRRRTSGSMEEEAPEIHADEAAEFDGRVAKDLPRGR
jgi:hypothetical protein